MKYPQSLFTQKIKSLVPIGTKAIIDAPCGSGETTYELAQYFPDAQLTGVDLDKKGILLAQKKYRQKNLKYQTGDIHNFVEKSAEFEVFCLINSLFLLPNPKELLTKISEKLTGEGQLILILPNPHSTNFKRYQKIAPDVNSFILARDNYDTFFSEIGLKISSCEGIVRIPFYGRRDTKLLYLIRDRYLFWLESRSKSEDYGYYLIVLKKNI